MCGTTKVEFTVSYDSHTRSADSNYPPEKEFATTYNSLLLAHFKQLGEECKFTLIPKTGGAASNKVLNADKSTLHKHVVRLRSLYHMLVPLRFAG